jgi:hypothetical protein
VPEDGGLIGQALIGLKPVNAWVHTYTKPQTSSTRSRGLGWRIHESVEDTKLSTNKQHSLSTFCVSTPGRPRQRGGVRADRLLGGERGRAGRAVVVAVVRLVGAERAQTALVCGGGVGLGAREAEAVHFCCCCVDEARAELVLRTHRAAGACAAVEVFVVDTARDALVIL